MSDGIHIESDDPDATADQGLEVESRSFDEVGEPDSVPDEDIEAEEDRWLEEGGHGIPDDAQPESQGEDPLIAELGEDGNGDLAPEDE